MKTKKSYPLSKVYQLIEPGPVVMVTTQYKEEPNIMTMSWLTMIEFEPPLIACIMSEDNYSFIALKKTKECVINIPTAAMIKTVVGVGNSTGSETDKFKKFKLSPLSSSQIDVPMIAECYANLECTVVDTKMVTKYTCFYHIIFRKLDEKSTINFTAHYPKYFCYGYLGTITRKRYYYRQV